MLDVLLHCCFDFLIFSRPAAISARFCTDGHTDAKQELFHSITLYIFNSITIFTIIVAT